MSPLQGSSHQEQDLGHESLALGVSVEASAPADPELLLAGGQAQLPRLPGQCCRGRDGAVGGFCFPPRQPPACCP